MPALRYRLDDLGWYHFELLIQSLLKAELGVGVQSWGGHSDRGIDAYSQGPLEFPGKGIRTAGPFVFQAKFVESANAGGAKPMPLLAKAVSAEAREIKRRIRKGRWRKAKQYVLVTNVSLGVDERSAIKKKLAGAIAGDAVTTLGGRDVCDMLDRHRDLRRSFPELLSVADLDLLLAETANRAILERSRVAIDEAREAAAVFVATRAYFRAWRVLTKHHFVVLDGPPEMGKTVIARMISLLQVATGWQGVDCRRPDDFFSMLRPREPQVFVADDAFGRTEYDITLGRAWEHDLGPVLRRLDPKHWLIWTSRRHILVRALRDMDLVGNAEAFPSPGEVVVTAQALSVEEKARILYRHAKAADLDRPLRKIVQDQAETIVGDEHFTPERIRRFVRDSLPRIGRKAGLRRQPVEATKREVVEAIRDPTDRMRKSFRKLPETHKWILISLVDSGEDRGRKIDLRQDFERHRESVSASVFQESLDDLRGSFLRRRKEPYHVSEYDWIHPSYRDLVIEELARDPDLLLAFLRNCSLEGIKLAISEAGGYEGERRLPLVLAEASWVALAYRCEEYAKTAMPEKVGRLLEAILGTLEHEPAGGSVFSSLTGILGRVCEEAQRRWDADGTLLPAAVLEKYERARRRFCPQVPPIQLGATWESRSADLWESIRLGIVQSPELVAEWIHLVEVLEEYRSEFFENEVIREGYSSYLGQLAETVEYEAGVEPWDVETWHLEDESNRLFELAEALRDFEPQTQGVAVSFEGSSRSLRTKARELSDHSEEDDDAYEHAAPARPRKQKREFNVKALFEDL